MPRVFGRPTLSRKSNSDATIRVVTDFPSMDDASAGYLFADQAGKVIRSMFRQAGVSLSSCEIVSVFPEASSPDEFRSHLVGKLEASKQSQLKGLFDVGKYLSSKQLAQAEETLKYCTANPVNMTLVLGPTAGKLFFGNKDFKLDSNRGSILSDSDNLRKTVFTYHPRYILTKWKDYPLMLQDIIKASRDADCVLHTPPEGLVFVPETVGEAISLLDRVLASVKTGVPCAIDVETMTVFGDTQVDCIGFTISPIEAIVIPFFEREKLKPSTEPKVRRSLFSGLSTRAPVYKGVWTAKEETAILELIHIICSRKELDAVLQNGYYDVWHLWRTYGIPITNGWEDTMLQSHTAFVELPKGLDVLGSLYTERPSWKQLRQFGNNGE